MAVAFSTNVSALGSAQNPTFSITVTGANPVLTVKVGLDSTTATVTSVSWSGTSNSTGETKNARSGTAFNSHSFIAGPSAGAGTVTVNKSAAAINHQIDVGLFTGADQSNPCPSADAKSSVVAATSTTLTPSNLTANDASDGAAVNTVADNPTGVTPNQRYLDSTTSVNLETGDATGTTGITFTYNSGTGSEAFIAARIQAPTAGGLGISLGNYTHPGQSPGSAGLMGSARFLMNWWPYSPPAIVTFDASLMAAMVKSGNDPLVLPPQVVASGMTPPNNVPS